MRRACVVYGGAQERQEILLGGESPVYLNWKLNVNLLRLFIDKNLGLELKYFKLKFFWVNNYDNTRKELSTADVTD